MKTVDARERSDEEPMTTACQLPVATRLVTCEVGL